MYPKWNPGKWKHDQNLRSPGGLILTHTQFMKGYTRHVANKRRVKCQLHQVRNNHQLLGKELEDGLGGALSQISTSAGLACK